MFLAPALGFLNHLLAGEEWARARLKPFAGQGLRFSCGPLVARLAITEQGIFREADEDLEATVSLTLPPDAPWRALQGRSAILASATVSGSAELAEALAFVLRNVRWDIEDDLARIVGDIAARRLVQGGRSLVAWQGRATKNMALNFAEYFTEENPLLVGKDESDEFALATDSLAQAVELLEKRLDALEKRAT